MKDYNIINNLNIYHMYKCVCVQKYNITEIQ